MKLLYYWNVLIKLFECYVYNYKDVDFVELWNFVKFVFWDLVYEEDDMEFLIVKWMDFFFVVVDDCVFKIKVRLVNSVL